MNYLKIYNNIIERAKSDLRVKGGSVYYEMHHIIPKCLGENNSKENLVLLTAREHFIAHKLLSLIYPGNESLLYTVWMMSVSKNNSKRDYKVSSREYERYKIIHIELVSKTHSGKTVTEESRKKMSKSATGRKMSLESKMKRSEGGRGKPKSKEHCENLSKSATGRIMSKEAVDKMKNSLTGRTMSKESVLKGIETKKNKPVIYCPYCDVYSKNESNMKRFHFENCKNFQSNPILKASLDYINRNFEIEK